MIQQLGISRKCVCQIVKACPQCPRFHPVPHNGINSGGLVPNQLWTLPTFLGKLKYIHVTTFSGVLVATALTGEATKNVISRCLHCFSMLVVPNQIKTDNGTGYCRQAFEMFC